METKRSKSILSARNVVVAVVVVISFIAGFLLRGVFVSPVDEGAGRHIDNGGDTEETIWTCSMHPQIRRSEPGLCPLCGMELIVAGSGAGGERVIEFTEDAKKLMQVEVSPVERKFAQAEIRMVGKIDYDETRVKNITAWAPGRIDQLYVDYTGIKVNEGEHMVYLYSPQLLSAQAELLQAVKAVRDIGTHGGSELINRSIVATLEASREKLRLLGLTREQIKGIEESGEPVDHLTIFAPIGGVVIEKNVSEGVYVETGTRIYTVADLSKLWVKLDAYESDMMWIRYGQHVEFTTEAYPGEVFEGTISFIDPILDARTRTVKLRVNVDNSEGKLKPQMFVRAVVRPQIAASGPVMDAGLAGKWICSMHPDVIKDESGKCDICGMDLVPVESLGFVKDTATEPPLVIPASAPLITGKRAVVYVELPNMEKPTYQGREVVLGPRAGDYYIVESGLAEGELVVTRGNFKIDSSLQLQAKPSMMSADDTSGGGGDMEVERTFDVPEEFRSQIDEIVTEYLEIQSVLANDAADSAIAHAVAAAKAVGNVDMKLVEGGAHVAWMKYHESLYASLEAMGASGDIESIRREFENVSDSLTAVLKTFGVRQGRKLYRVFCPMAFNNKGAHWLQSDDKVRNPYFGADMPTCGEVVEMLGAE